MAINNTKHPKTGEVVITEVLSLNPNSIYVKLDEYELNGMVHVSELSTSWVKDIRKIAKKGQKLVLKVLPARGDRRIVNLSLKRVKPSQKREKLASIKNEKRAEKILEFIMERLDLGDDTKSTETKIISKLKEYYETLFNAFSTISAEGIDEDLAKELDAEVSSVIETISKEKIKAKILTIKGIITIKLTNSNGLATLKKALDINNPNIKVSYISAPKYNIEIEGKNYADMEKDLASIVEKVSKVIKSDNGDCQFAKV